MEENAQPTERGSALSPGWPWRLALAILIYGTLIVMSMEERTGPLAIRIAICFACMFTAGFWLGFRPHSENRELRATFYRMAVLGSFAALVLPTAHLAGIYALPSDQRYGAMLTPRYIGLYAALFGAYALSYPLGEMIYRRRHPDTAAVPATPEDLESVQVTPDEKRSMLRTILAVVLFCSPMFVSIWLWPSHSILVGAVTVAAMLCAFSVWVGYTWRHMDGEKRRFALILTCIGPPAGFIGYVQRGGVPSALLFAAKIAAVLVLPGVLGRLISHLRTGDTSS